jgi:hypothetical protein
MAPIRCTDLDLNSVLEAFPGQRVGFLITYLGLPLTLGRLKVVHVQRVLDKTRERLARWNLANKHSWKARIGEISAKCNPHLPPDLAQSTEVTTRRSG